MTQTVNLKIRPTSKAQGDFWRSKARFDLFVGGVNSGKTFGGAAKAIMQPPNTLGVVIAPTYPLLRDAAQRTFFELASQIPGYVVKHNDSKGHTHLADGKEVLWRSADKPGRIVGFNAHWGWGDEWALVDRLAHQNTMKRVRVGNWRFWATTTPLGHNWLYEAWVERPSPDHAMFRASTHDNKAADRAFIASLEHLLDGDPTAAQEMHGEFVDTSGSKRVSSAWVKRCQSGRLPIQHRDAPAVPRLIVYAPPLPGRRYLVAADPSAGLQPIGRKIVGDMSAVHVVCLDTGEQVAVFPGWLEPRDGLPHLCAVLSDWYNRARIAVERNNHGEAVIGALEHNGYEVEPDPYDGKPGHLTTTRSKVTRWDACAALCRDGWFKINHKQTAVQVGAVDAHTLSHPEKKTRKACDDLAQALAIVAEYVLTPASGAWFLRH